MLLYAGANVRATTRIKWLHAVAAGRAVWQCGRHGAALEAAADANGATANGATALMFAAAAGNLEAVKTLL